MNGIFLVTKKKDDLKKFFISGINLTAQKVCDDAQVTAVTNAEELSWGLGHGSHRQQINWLEPKSNHRFFLEKNIFIPNLNEKMATRRNIGRICDNVSTIFFLF